MVLIGQCLFHGPLQALSRPQSHPTDSTTSVIGHIHLIWTHQGRCCSGFAAHQEKWSWFTEAAICSEHKRTMDATQMQLGGKKNTVDSVQAWT